MGSPPQIETMGAPHSSDAARHSSTVMISLMVDLYSRIRPHPVHVRLQLCSGSSIITIGNFLAPRKRWVATYFARFAVIFMGYLNALSYVRCPSNSWGLTCNPENWVMLVVMLRYRASAYKGK